jgi:hypothetical protein
MRRGTLVTIPRRPATSWLTGRGPSATTALVALATLALLAVGCDARATPPPSHRLEGTYIVHGVFPYRTYGRPCKAADAGYPDIRSGTKVTVSDGTAAVLGTAALQGGTLRKGPLRGNDDDCVFGFSLTVPERDNYRIEVGQRRGVVPFSRSELERSGWKADLTIGAYTMFGGI